MSAMTSSVSKLPPPRISEMSHQVVTEIASRCAVSQEVVMQAMLLTSLANQSSLMDHINKLRGQASTT